MLNKTFNNNVYFKHLLKTFTKSEKYTLLLKDLFNIVIKLLINIAIKRYISIAIKRLINIPRYSISFF